MEYRSTTSKKAPYISSINIIFFACYKYMIFAYDNYHLFHSNVGQNESTTDNFDE